MVADPPKRRLGVQPTAQMGRNNQYICRVLCVTANSEARCSLWVMCPACLCGREAAGHNALRGSGSNQKHAFKDALTHTGCPDPRIDLVCITSSVLANSFNFNATVVACLTSLNRSA
jgi:hypothetical protein